MRSQCSYRGSIGTVFKRGLPVVVKGSKLSLAVGVLEPVPRLRVRGCRVELFEKAESFGGIDNAGKPG
ncbi:MAG: hypothetical protein DHS20C19_16480 [Acidimicrobiales bacterium]|nr:MAG: hypothetical protein DHS20C19_16480 [Acidimicrobiales bacterium]